jgi:hypothetical protein
MVQRVFWSKELHRNRGDLVVGPACPVVDFEAECGDWGGAKNLVGNELNCAHDKRYRTVSRGLRESRAAMNMSGSVLA